MKTTFRRNPVFPILILSAGILFGITTILQLSMNSPAVAFTGLASILSFVNAFWLFSIPIGMIENDDLYYKESLFKQKHYPLNQIEDIERTKKNVVVLKHANGTIKLRLDAMRGEDKEQFVTALLNHNSVLVNA